MFKERDVITLTTGVSDGETEAKAGAIGTIVHTYDNHEAFMVEFNYGDIHRCDLLNVLPSQARLATDEDFERERRELTVEFSGD